MTEPSKDDIRHAKLEIAFAKQQEEERKMSPNGAVCTQSVHGVVTPILLISSATRVHTQSMTPSPAPVEEDYVREEAARTERIASKLGKFNQ